MCDEVWFYKYDGMSKGQMLEMEYANDIRKWLRFMNIPIECIRMEDDTMLCEKCYDNICTIRTRLDNFREDIDGMTPRDKKYYCEEMASMLKEYDVVANEVNLDLKIDECFRTNKRLV